MNVSMAIVPLALEVEIDEVAMLLVNVTALPRSTLLSQVS